MTSRRRNRTAALRPSAGTRMILTRIKKGLTRFPSVQESGTFLDEFLCEVAVYDPEMRSVRYSKPDDKNDDALHAANYAQLVGLRTRNNVL